MGMSHANGNQVGGLFYFDDGQIGKSNNISCVNTCLLSKLTWHNRLVHLA